MCVCSYVCRIHAKLPQCDVQNKGAHLITMAFQFKHFLGIFLSLLSVIPSFGEKVVPCENRSTSQAVALPLSTFNTPRPINYVPLPHVVQMSLAELLRRLRELALFAAMHFCCGLCTRSAPPLWLFVVSGAHSVRVSPLFCADLASNS